MKKIIFLCILLINTINASTFTNKLEEECNRGDSNACGVLANMYEKGSEVPQNSYKAIKLYTKSCKMGEPLACVSLGVLYEFGKGTKQNIKKAKSLYKTACEGGNSIGCKNYNRLTNNTTVSPNNIKNEIISRCRKDMAEYGPSLIKACVDQDLDAALYLGKLIENNKYNNIVNRCMNQMYDYGYAMVKACVNQDIEAERALSNY